jgi:hypothetical protein
VISPGQASTLIVKDVKDGKPVANAPVTFEALSGSRGDGTFGVDPFRGQVKINQKGVHDARNTPTLSGRVPTKKGRAGLSRSISSTVGQRVRALCSGHPQLGHTG